jgi:hypothetical protein
MGNTISSRPEDGNPMKIWDVPALWELARDLPVEEVELEALGELDRVAWYGPDHHDGRLTVRQVTRHLQRILEADLARPILLSPEGHLLDGFHRLAKAHLEGHAHIAAQRLPVMPEPLRLVEMPEFIHRTYH